MKRLIESFRVNWKLHLLAALFTALLFTKRKMIEEEKRSKQSDSPETSEVVDSER